MADVAQLAERQVVVLDVAGSSPVVRPRFSPGKRASLLFVNKKKQKNFVRFCFVSASPRESNPRTGKLTPLSVLAGLRGLVSTLKVGS